MTIFERGIKAKFICFYEKRKPRLWILRDTWVCNLTSIAEYLTNFNSKMAFFVLINASIY
jgi:hypothetical protein